MRSGRRCMDRASWNPVSTARLDEGQESNWESAWHGWWSRHAIQAAREGGVFPDVIFRRFQDSIEISWGDSRSQGVPNHVNFALRPGSFASNRTASPSRCTALSKALLRTWPRSPRIRVALPT